MSMNSLEPIESSLCEVGDLTRFAGCTPSEWHLPENTNTKSRFKQNLLIQLTRETPRSDSLVERMLTVPWAGEFIRDRWEAVSDGPFVGARAKAAYKRDPFDMTKQLADLVNCFFFTWLRNCFRRKVSQWEAGETGESFMRKPFSMKETEAFAEELEPDIVAEIEEDHQHWEDAYKDIYSAIRNSETWRRLGQRVGTFCRDLGCPGATDDAHDALDALRQYNLAVLRDTASWKLQVELKAKVAEVQALKEQLELYQKAIACLSFRSLLENLPDPQYRYNGTPRSISATSHWKNFLAAAKDEAKSGGDGEHPLFDLAAEHASTIQDGNTMYSSLSNNIHGFSQNLNALNEIRGSQRGSEFAIKSIHFDPGQFQFLSAMVPRHWKKDGSVNMEKERERYGVVWDEEKFNVQEGRKGSFVARSKYNPPPSQGSTPATPSQAGKENQLPSNLNTGVGTSSTNGSPKQVSNMNAGRALTTTQPKAKPKPKKNNGKSTATQS